MQLNFLKALGDGFTGKNTAEYIAENYPWEAAAWYWSASYNSDDGNLNAYVNNNYARNPQYLKEYFIITQYYVNDFTANNADLVAINNGTKYTIDDDWLCVNGNNNHAPMNWSDRDEKYNDAVKIFFN